MTRSFEYHYVLFLDVLGYKELIERSAESQESFSVNIENLYKAFLSIRNRYVDRSEFSIKMFSDSILLSLPFNKNRFDDFIKEIAEIQLEFLSIGILTRGGACVGKHLEDDDFVASTGLIEAYNLEQSVAKFPRVVVSNDLLDLVFNNKEDLPSLLMKYMDAYYSIDYLGHNNFNEDEISKTRETIHEIVKLSEKISWGAKEKVLWLADYWNHRHPEFTVAFSERFLFKI